MEGERDIGRKHIGGRCVVTAFGVIVKILASSALVLCICLHSTRYSGLWIGIGKDDFLLQRNQEFIATLKEKDIHHEWHLTDGNHSWPVWRIYLAELAPKLFQ